MDQDATWYGDRPRPRPHCVRWGPSSPKGAQPSIFGTYLLWPNGHPSQLLLSTCQHSVASTLKCIINPALQTVANGSFLRQPLVTLERRSKPSFSQSSKLRKKIGRQSTIFGSVLKLRNLYFVIKERMSKITQNYE